MVGLYGDIFEEEMARESVFKDQSKLSPDYVPESLVHRDEEFRELSRLFKPVLQDKASQRVLITGSVGVGKTALSTRFGREFEEAASRRGLSHDYVHVNCRKNGTPHLVLRRIAEKYLPRLPRRGFAHQELLAEVFRLLESKDAYLTVALDELDFFVRQNGADLLYSLTRVGEDLNAPNRLNLIAISRTKNFARLLDEATRSTFLHNRIELDKYDAEQLADILRDRIKVAFTPDAVRDDCVDLISEVASRRGDARFALELLWVAGRAADAEGSEEVVSEHARKAKAQIHPGIRSEILRDLERHERLLLLAGARRLKISDKSYLLTGELKEAYEVVCEEYSEKPYRHTKIWELLRRMSNLGVIDTRPSGKKHRGKSQRISISDAPVSMLEEELSKLLERSSKS